MCPGQAANAPPKDSQVKGSQRPRAKFQHTIVFISQVWWLPITQSLSMESNSNPQKTLGNVWRHFVGLSQGVERE